MLDDTTYMNAVHRTLKRGDVIRIKSKPPFESEKYHFFVVLNIDPASEDVLLLVSGTSQVQKRLEVRRNVAVVFFRHGEGRVFVQNDQIDVGRIAPDGRRLGRGVADRLGRL